MSKRIDDGIIDDAINTNSHGVGIAWLDQDKKVIRWAKGLDKANAKKILDGPAKGTPHVFHARIATDGGVCDELTHPFPIGAEASIETEGEADAVLFHNGRVGDWQKYLFQAYLSSGLKVAPPPWSDTRAMAFLCHVHGPHVLSLVSEGSRFLVFDAKTSPAERMLRWGTWHEYQSFSFSNRGTRAFNPPYVAPITRAPERQRQSSYVGGGAATVVDRRSSAADTHSSNRKYRPPASYEVWTKFTHDGLSLNAADEVQDAELVAPLNPNKS